MTSVSGLEISIFRIPLDVAGSQLVSQQCGYFHAWRFLNSDGTLSLDGEISASFGGQWNTERVPFTYNSRLALGTPVDRVLIEWAAQPGRVAEILLTRDPRGLDGQNTPARQLVFQGQATAMQNSAVTVGTTAAQIVAANSRRSRAIITAPAGNPSVLYFGPVGVTLANGTPLEPGQSMVGLSSAEYHAIAPVAGCSVRILEELA
jgi:RES domain-containing protein